MHTDTRNLLVLVALAVILFFIHGGGYDLWPPDEPRYAEVAREMLVSGDFLTPRVNGVTYTEKPPLLFWLMALCGLPFGEVNEWAARLPSMFCGLYVVVLTHALGRRLFGPRAAELAALLLMTSVGFWLQARKGQIDMLLAAALLTTLYAFWRWDTERAGKWLWLAYGGMAAGLLAKGPPALVFPLLFLFTYYWKNPEGRRRSRWLAGSLAALGVALLWYIPARLAGADTAAEALGSGIGGNLFRNTIGRFILGVSKAQAPWYYLETLPLDFLPWTLLSPPLLYWIWKQRSASQATWFLFSWVAPALVFFSICIGKRGLYLVPLFPAIALLLAAAWVAEASSGRLRWAKIGIVFWSAILIGMAFAPLALPFLPFPLQNPIHAYALAFVGGLAGLGGLLWLRVGGAGRAPAILAAQTCLMYITLVFTAFPEVDHFKSARAICAPVRQLADAGVSFKLYSVGFSREEYIYYARRFHEPVLTSLVGEIAPERLLEEARLQKEAQRVIASAVEDIPIADLTQVTEAERKNLTDAIRSAVSAHEEAESIEAFEQALLQEVDRFMETFMGPEPAFAFVEEDEWRWIVPLYENKLSVHLIAERRVGSRHVLLLANRAASALAPRG